MATRRRIAVTKVDITTAGHTVIVESDQADLDTVAAKALELWRSTRDPKLDQAQAAAGFQAERADAVYVSGHDADLGHRHSQ
jgi:hypothetical protein